MSHHQVDLVTISNSIIYACNPDSLGCIPVCSRKSQACGFCKTFVRAIAGDWYDHVCHGLRIQNNCKEVKGSGLRGAETVGRNNRYACAIIVSVCDFNISRIDARIENISTYRWFNHYMIHLAAVGYLVIKTIDRNDLRRVPVHRCKGNAGTIGSTLAEVVAMKSNDDIIGRL